MQIKISSAGLSGSQDLSQFTGNVLGEIDGCHISMGDPNLDVADAWFVIEDTGTVDCSCVVPANQIHFLSAETAWSDSKYLNRRKKRFLSQFSQVHTFYKTSHKRATFSPPFLPWMINANHGSVYRAHDRDINFFARLDALPKRRPLSMFCSDQTWRPEHRSRLAFARAVKKYFGEDVVWFGNGVNPVGEKWDGLASFERTIVLENTTRLNVYSEKIMDPFLALCEPIYWGNPNIQAQFPIMEDQIIYLDDVELSLKRIAQLIEKPVSAERFANVLRGRDLVLNERHFLRRICAIAKATATAGRRGSRRNRVLLQPASSFS